MPKPLLSPSGTLPVFPWPPPGGSPAPDWDRLLPGYQNPGSLPWDSFGRPPPTRATRAGLGGFVEWSRFSLQFVDESGAAQPIPFAWVGGIEITSVRFWNGDLLVATFGGDNRAGFAFSLLGLDGTLRWRGEGRIPTPISPEILVAASGGGLVAIDAQGHRIGRIEGLYPDLARGSTEVLFVPLDGDVLFSDGLRVVRAHPRDGRLVWLQKLAALSELNPPILVGSTVAVTTNLYGQGKTVWLLDAQSGRLRGSGAAAARVKYLCPVGDNAVVACSYSQKLVGWRHLATSPERFVLDHPEKVFDALSPQPASIVTRTASKLTFWQL